MNTDSTPTPREVVRREQSFPLLSIVQLVTYCVALVSCINFKKLGKQIDTVPSVDAAWMVAMPVAAVLLGFLLGASIGLGQIRKWRGFFLCGMVGAMIGLLILATFAAPAEPLQACFACMLPLVSTLVLRYRTA